MDALDEINVEVEKLCAIAERERTAALERIIDHVVNCDINHPQGWTLDRAQVAALALDYAAWTRSLDGYRSLLRRGDVPIARVK